MYKITQLIVVETGFEPSEHTGPIAPRCQVLLRTLGFCGSLRLYSVQS